MNVTIHQPTYLPYLGVIAKIASADILIVYDTAQYEKGSVHNRQQIRTAQGSTWMTIPLKTSLTPFNDTPISYDDTKHPWYENHWRTIEQNYTKTPFFAQYREELFRHYHENHPRTLADFNFPLFRFLLNAFGLKPRVVFFSELGIADGLTPSEQLAAAVVKTGGTHYISGPSGKRYLEAKPFLQRNIGFSFFEFTHPMYPQYHARYDSRFLPNMASIDALFNTGTLPLSQPAEERPRHARHYEKSRSTPR